MGDSEGGKTAKQEKSSSPAPPDQNNQANSSNIHVYPDWTAMQAYYGARVPLPPYYNSAVASGHAPHPYVWGPPQHMMPPYGAPYAAIYSHGNVYAHPTVSVGQLQGHGIPTTAAATGTPLSIETPTKSSGNTSQGLMKKLKGFDGLAMSLGNGSPESTDAGTEHRLSQSVDTECSDRSDGNTSKQNRRKGSREGTPIGKESKTDTKANLQGHGELNAGSDKVLGIAVSSAGMTGTLVGSVVPPGMSMALELGNPATMNAKPAAACPVLPGEAWLHSERELKRERRKQSNRESARRSRLRKQAETEELARKVESLTSENDELKSEINWLTENSEKLKQENAALTDKLKSAQSGQAEEASKDEIDDGRPLPVPSEKPAAGVANSGERSVDAEGDGKNKNSSSGAKLRQLLGTPRTDAVAAG